MNTAPRPANARHLLDQATRFSRWGRFHEAIGAYRQACCAAPDTATHYVALVGLARALESIGQPEQAMDACHSAIQLSGDPSPAFGVLALLLMRAGRLDEAAAVAKDACSRDVHTPAMLCLAATIALLRARVDEAITATSAALAREPAYSRALALRALAVGWRDGQADVRQLVRVRHPATPKGFSSIDVFNRALADSIRQHELLETGGDDSALVQGARLHDIFTLPPAQADALRAMFLTEAGHYAAELCAGALSCRYDVRGWATVMGIGAYEKPHIHDDGWLSCVYYPRLPEHGSTGCDIVFGPHDLGPLIPSPAPYHVRPTVGQMIVFPSWLYHSTIPFSGSGLRISVAADVMRLG